MGHANGENDKGRGRNGLWTMQDIAHRVNLSPKTVSRVVNGEEGVSEDTRKRVLEIIKEVGYVPHSGARSMRSDPRDCVGVTVPAPVNQVPISESFFLRLFAEMYHIFGEEGHVICFDMNPHATDVTGNYARGLWEQRYSACVICGPLKEDDPVIRRVHSAGFPYLSFSRLDSVPDISSSVVDYEEAARQSAEYFIKREHTRIGMVQGFKGFHSAIERERGYRRAHRDGGVRVDPDLLYPVNFGAHEIVEAVRTLLSDHTVTALIDASGAQDAESLREGARLAGRELGKDVELLTWTYAGDSGVLKEACARMWLPLWEAGIEGLKELKRWFDDEIEGPIQVLVPPTLYDTPTLNDLPEPRQFFGLT